MIFSCVTTDRKRSRSPFPSAYKVLAEAEQSNRKTVRVGPTIELLQGCKEHDGVKCKNCNTWDETGVDWHMVVFLEEEATPKYSWYCKLCFRPDEHGKSDYVYSGRNLENAVEHFGKKKV